MPLFVALFVLVLNPLQAAEPITGGFGVRLGAAFDSATALSEETDNFHFNYYLVDPPEISPDFQHYGVYVTPFSKVIYRIVASGRFHTEPECLSAARRMVWDFSDRHGNPVENELYLKGPVRFAVGPRTIVLECRASPNVIHLHITFSDSVLTAEAR